MSRFFGKRTAGKVVQMDRFRSGKSLSPIRQAEAYWSALRIGSAVPRRTQIDPRGLENILEYTFILERIAPGVARFRLAGHHLNDLAGMEVRGMPLTVFFTAAARAQIGSVLEHMFDTPAVAELSLKSARVRTPIEARMILLPLANETGEVTRVLGVLIGDGPMTSDFVRFDLAASTLRPVNPVNGTVGATPSVTRPAPRRPAHGFGEAPEPFDAPESHLRLVK